jgi:membrane protease YdiL (CAAX protease family)
MFVSLFLLSLGILFQTMRGIDFNQGWLGFCSYCLWGLFQQYVLNSYFVNRLSPVTNHAALAAAALFSSAHAPNWFLMPVTLLGGYCCAKVYLRYRNLYFLGLAHGAVGFLLYLVVPDSVSHHLCVGPSWFAH